MQLILVKLPNVFSQPHLFIKIAFHPFTLFLAATTINLKYKEITKLEHEW